jgi:hypothetical protein
MKTKKESQKENAEQEKIPGPQPPSQTSAIFVSDPDPDHSVRAYQADRALRDAACSARDAARAKNTCSAEQAPAVSTRKKRTPRKPTPTSTHVAALRVIKQTALIDLARAILWELDERGIEELARAVQERLISLCQISKTALK